MTKEDKALLDMFAYCEGTLGVSNNGYDVIVGTKRVIAGWTKDTNIVHGGSDWTLTFPNGLKSNAAGRYQFIYSTWLGGSKTKPGPNLPMSKANQDKRGLELLDAALGNMDKTKFINKPDFDKALNKLCKVWASIPVTSDIIDNYPKPNTLHKAGFSYYDSDGVNKAKLSSTKIFEIYKLALSKY